MQRALIIGDSGGIGGAIRDRLALRLGAGNVHGLSRSRDGLDICDESSVVARFDRLEGPYDLVVVATGALAAEGRTPEKTIRDIDASGLMAQFEINALGPALVLKHVLPLVPRGRRSVIAALSARVGSIGDNRLGGWYSYRASKAALNQIYHSAAVELARTHRHAICVTLHPGTVATRFTEAYRDRHPSMPPEQAAEHLITVLDGLKPEDSGRFFDWAGKEVPW